MAKKTQAFQAEVKEILDLMVHSLYSNKEVFLRELISNASDAVDKLKFTALTDTSLKVDKDSLHIRLKPDSKAKTLTISDNGIGMSLEEVEKNIGTIAHSGTKSFVEKSKELKNNPELIGQFGVGFYSSFMVADEVILHTQKAGTTNGVVWTSKGDGEYTIEEVPRAEGNGTTITLKLKDFKDDDSVEDFSSEFTLKSLVKKYSDFLAYPVKMQVEKENPVMDKDGKPVEGKTEKIIEDETLNSQKALWLKSPSEVKEEEHEEFYKHLSHDWNKPLKTIHFKAEGTQEYSSILYIPEKKPWNFNYRDVEWGLELYVKRVFIMSNCEELMPHYFRFIKGVVDSSDLSLNVSREILQKDRQVQLIRKGLVGKIFKTFSDMLKNDREQYEKLWDEFGSTLKEGVPSDYENKEKLEKLLLFHTSQSDKMTTLEEYVSRMTDSQKGIYFITGESIDKLQNSPYLEKLSKKGYEVLFLIDPVDEWVIGAIPKFADKPVQSIMSADIDLDTDEEKKANEEVKKGFEEKFKDVTEVMKKSLEKEVKDVRFSDRLTDSPVCLVADSGSPSAHMEKMMKSMGQDVPGIQRVLEINANHPIFEKMLSLSKDEQTNWSEILYSQALLNEGSSLPNPQKFSQLISKLMVN